MLVENPQTEKERLLDTGTRRESDVENHSAIKQKKCEKTFLRNISRSKR